MDADTLNTLRLIVEIIGAGIVVFHALRKAADYAARIMETQAVTNEKIDANQRKTDEQFAEINSHLKTLNGSVAKLTKNDIEQDRVLAVHSALLEERTHAP